MTTKKGNSRSFAALRATRVRECRFPRLQFAMTSPGPPKFQIKKRSLFPATAIKRQGREGNLMGDGARSCSAIGTAKRGHLLRWKRLKSCLYGLFCWRGKQHLLHQKVRNLGHSKIAPKTIAASGFRYPGGKDFHSMLVYSVSSWIPRLGRRLLTLLRGLLLHRLQFIQQGLITDLQNLSCLPAIPAGLGQNSLN